MRAGQRCRSLAARAVAAEADVVEGKLRSPPSHEGIRVSFQSGQISAVGCRPMLEDVNAEVFVSRSSDEALILGLESGNGASSMHDIALGKVLAWLSPSKNGSFRPMATKGAQLSRGCKASCCADRNEECTCSCKIFEAGEWISLGLVSVTGRKQCSL